MRRIASLVLLLAVVAAGCGGESTETTTQVETQQIVPLPRTEYIEVADTICRNHRSRREDLESQAADLGPLDSADKAHRAADLLRQESSNLQAELHELRALRVPVADAATVDSILFAVQARMRVIDDWAGAYDDLDEARIRALQLRLGVITARAENRARAYGFEACGQ